MGKIKEVALEIAWVHWMRMNPHDVSEDAAQLWANLSLDSQLAYDLAARAALAAIRIPTPHMGNMGHLELDEPDVLVCRFEDAFTAAIDAAAEE